MSRWEFMRQLEELLSDISPSEREEALQYYNDYFNDAGRENEQEVINALGSPSQVADIVREGLSENVSSGEFTERGFKNEASFQQNPVIKREGNVNTQEHTFTGSDEGTEKGGPEAYGDPQTEDYQRAESEGAGAYEGEIKSSSKEKKESLPTWAIVLIIVGCIILAHAIIGGIGGILGGLLGIVAGIAAFIIGIAAAAVVLYLSAVLLIVAGIGCIFVAPIKGIGLLGGGFICGALGILCMLFTYLLAAKAIPGIYRGVIYIYHKVADKIGGRKR